MLLRMGLVLDLGDDLHGKHRLVCQETVQIYARTFKFCQNGKTPQK